VEFNVTAFEVDALVVVALSVVMLPVDAKRLVNAPEIAVSEFANRDVRIFKLFIDDVAATIWFPAIFVPVRSKF
jgi:hypothetical protein